MAKRALLVLGCVLCGVLIPHSAEQFVGQLIAQETISPKPPSTAGKSLKEKRDEAVKAEAKAAVAEMIRKLGKGEYVEFLHQHSPIEEYVSAFRDGRAGQVPFSALPQFLKLSETLKSMQDAEITVDRSGKVVHFVRQEELKKADRPQSPYTSAEKPVEPGYGNDLEMAIESALRDLKEEKYEVFMSRMLPKSTILMMKADDRWDDMITSLSADAPKIKSMISDLSILAKADPVIADGTAEFTLPNVAPMVRGRKVEDVEVGKRVIRFSLVDGSWRFFDSNANTAAELDAALNRDAAGESLRSQLVLEKIGSDWRLTQTPRSY